ncbi:MAG: DNA double-strand break repair nuclease NurA [Nitrososphaerota archaeon]
MLEELFRRAQALRERLAQADRRTLARALNRARKLWVPYEPRDAGEELRVLGVDSGWNVRLYEGFYVYALRAAAVDEAEQVRHSLVEFEAIAGEQDGLTPELWLKTRAEMAEHGIAAQASHEADLVLVDGSMIARLLSASLLLPSGSRNVEYLQRARALRGRENVLFIAKFSQGVALLGEELGDIYYLGTATSEPGYALVPPREVHDVRVSTAYVRLVEHARPLRIESPAPLDDERIRRIMDALAPRSVKGYPYALYLAHRTVYVGSDLMDMLCEAAGLSALPEAREVLEL